MGQMCDQGWHVDSFVYNIYFPRHRSGSVKRAFVTRSDTNVLSIFQFA